MHEDQDYYHYYYYYHYYVYTIPVLPSPLCHYALLYFPSPCLIALPPCWWPSCLALALALPPCYTFLAFYCLILPSCALLPLGWWLLLLLLICSFELGTLPALCVVCLPFPAPLLPYLTCPLQIFDLVLHGVCLAHCALTPPPPPPCLAQPCDTCTFAFTPFPLALFPLPPCLCPPLFCLLCVCIYPTPTLVVPCFPL